MSSLLLEGGTIVTMDADCSIIHDGALLVENGTIAYVGPWDASLRNRATDTIDATGRAILPGLINSHTHLCMIYGRTIAVERDLMSWLSVQVPLISALDYGNFYLAELLGAIENLKNGNTTVVENLFAPHKGDEQRECAAFEAFQVAGIRGVVARCHQSRNFAEEFLETTEQQKERVKKLYEQWHLADGGRLRLAIGPQLPWAVDESGLRNTRKLADELGIGIHMHVAENPNFNREIERHFGRSVRNVELLYETGCLGPNTQVVAVSDVNEREISLLAETGTRVVFDPQTRLYWGTGFADIPQFTSAGLVCSLGTNGPAANCGQSIFESMKYACATAKTSGKSPKALGCRRALKMATIEAAESLNIHHEVGSLEKGKRGDVITVDISQPHHIPAFDVEATLVYAGGAGDVQDVIVDGKVLMKNRRLVHINEDDLILAVCESAPTAMKEAGLDPNKLIEIREQGNVA